MKPDEQILAAGLDSAKSYVDLILKPPLEQIGGILSDTLGSWRMKNQIKLLLGAKKYLDEMGIKPEQLQPNVFVPLLEAGGDTDDETIADMFARLLATHLDPARKTDVHPSYAKVLGQLNGLDANMLAVVDANDRQRSEAFRRIREAKQGIGYRQLQLTEMRLIELMKERCATIGAAELLVSAENLNRLGLIEEMGMTMARTPDDSRGQGYALTSFGARFFAACSSEGTWRDLSGSGMEQRFNMHIQSQKSWRELNESLEDAT